MDERDTPERRLAKAARAFDRKSASGRGAQTASEALGRQASAQESITGALAGRNALSAAQQAIAARTSITDALGAGVLGTSLYDAAQQASAARTALTGALGTGGIYGATRQADAARTAISDALGTGGIYGAARHADAARTAISDALGTGALGTSLHGAAQQASAARTALSVGGPYEALLPAPVQTASGGAGAPSQHAAGAHRSGASAVPRPQRDNAEPVREPADLGRAVREARKARGLNQQAFADLAGVGRRFVSELESGKSTLEFGKVLRCCAAAGIDILAARRRLA